METEHFGSVIEFRLD